MKSLPIRDEPSGKYYFDDVNQFARSFPENEAQGGGSISENMLLERDEGGVWEQEISNILSTE